VPIPETVPVLGVRWDDVLFLAFAAIMLGAGLLVVTLRDIIRCGLAMIVCFGALAGLFVMLGAPISAAAEVLIYIGAISVLILFAVMITETKSAPTRLVFQTQAIPAAIASIVLAVAIAIAVTTTEWGAVEGPRWTDPEDVARLLFEEYVLHFEIVGALLLVSIIGGIFLASREDREA
jgi:NADH-quinone oxidoreductase subunit J/NAD(P)H-quinone oxidoreductase subunit 6